MDGGYPAEPTETENLNGTVGTNAAYTPKTGGAYEGFTYKSALTKVNNTVQTEGTINADSSTVVELYYERNTVNVTFKLAGGNVSGNTADILKTGKYGTALTAPAPEREGYAFKGWSPAPPSPLAFPAINTEYTAQWKINKYPVTFSVDGAGGTLKAKADGVAETETSPITVEHGKTVAFTAAPAAGYRVKGWTLDGTAIAKAGTNTEYTLTVTKPATITVSFEPKKALLTLEAGKNTVKVKAKTADGSAIKVEGCNVNELANDTETTLTVTNSERKLALIGDIIELDCSGEEFGNRPLASLDVSGCTALQKLNCQYNQIPELDVQGLTKLQKLNCQYNQIPELDVQGLTKLQKLYCQDNNLSTLNVSGCTALKELICINNQISELNVQGCATLKVLNCRYNKIAELNVSGLTELQELICNVNKIPELNVQGLTKLQQLKCGGNQLKTLDVQGLTELQQLYCQNNQLPALDVQDLATLQKLDCSENQLKTLNVQGCTALKELICYQNKLNADVFTKLLNDLPTREVSDGAEAILYAQPGVYNPQVEDGNCKNFTTPESLKKAFEGAKAKHWKLQKAGHFGFGIDI
ncbi:leucine-rich repeat domain-containing protein [Treponema sp. OMZ 305]|nr:leucine-rich repeat domain-containing protein [Treponema sp. OMZ 305]